jgi:hypothetical protein
VDIFAEALKRLQEREQKFAAVSAAELQGGGAAPMDPMAGAGGGMPPGAPMDPAMAGGMPPGAPMDPAMAGGMPPGAPMDPAMMDPAMMDPAMMDPAAAGGMPPEEDPLVLLLDALDEITKQTKQSNVMLAAIVDAFNVKIDTKDLLEMEEPPAGKESSQQPQQVAAPTTRLVEKAATEGRPGMPSSYALASSPSAALSQMCRVAAKHFQSRG